MHAIVSYDGDMVLASMIVALCVPMHVELLFTSQKTIPPGTAQAIVREAGRVWAPYGVVLHASEAADALAVSIRDHATSARDGDAWSRPLGQIRFADAREPQAMVSLFYDAAIQLIAGARVSDVATWEFVVAHQPEVIGRVLGRALAHEVGHYLLHSSGHSVLGLMRADHPITELLGDDRRRFELMPDEARRAGVAASRRSDVAAASGSCE